jgi:glycosyltransferase involved in cell wall biosynthesis
VRILAISNVYPPVALGGYERNCAEITERLRLQHEVLVLTSSLDCASVGRDPGVQRLLPWVPETRRGALRAPACAVRSARVVRGVLRGLRPDLVCVWNGSQISHAALRVVADAGVPVLYHVYEHWFGRLYSGDQFMRYLTPGARGARAAWSTLARTVNEHPALRLDGAAPARAAIAWASEALRELTPLPAGTDVVLERLLYPAHAQTVQFAQLARRPLERPTIAFVGRVMAQKGPDIAYRALALLRASYGIDARLVVAGPWERRARAALDELAAQLGIADHVDVRGQLGTADLGTLLQGAHVLVVPSRWEEPFGVVCLEGACARVPVVAARVGGIPEILREGEQALYFDKEDVEGCARALADVISDPGGADARAQRAFVRSQELSFERYVGESLRLVDDTMAAFAGA